MRLNPFAPKDNPLYESLYCFGGGDDGGGADDGDTGDTGVSASVAAGGRGWGPSRGPDDRDESSNDSQDRRVQSTGSTTNFNIDRSQPSVVADVNGTQRTVYGTQENLDKAVASGDLAPVGNVQDNYTPGTDAAASVYGNIVGNQSAQAAAGPALADTNIFSPTNITGEVFQTPYQQSVTTPQQRMEKAYIDAAVRGFRTDQPFGLADRSVIGMMTPMEAAENSFMNDISVFAPETIDPTRPDLALDPSRPAVSIRGATPAEQITAEARAAANQLTGPGRTRPTAAEVAAANERLTARTPGLQEAIAGGIMPANIEGQYGMQPTTTEVDAYNQAINDQIADQLGIASYDPATFGATGPISQVSTAPISQQDYTNLQAGRGVIQGGIAGVNQMVDQAMKEVELETGVPASQMQGIMASGAQQRATANRDQMAAEMAADQRLTGASGAATELLGGYDRAMAEQRALANRDQMAAEMAADQGTFDPRISAGVMSDSPQQFDLEQMQLANDLISRSTPAANRTPVTLDRALQKDREGYMRPGVDYELADSRENVPGRAALNEIDRAVAEEEAFRASQAATPGAADIARPTTNQELVARTLRDMGLSESAIQGGIAPEGTLPGNEERGIFLGDNIVRDPRPQFENPLADVPYLSTIGEVGTGIANSFFRSTAQVDDMIAKGAREITDENGFRVGAFDPDSKTVYSVAGESFNPALEPFYAQQREAQAAQQDQGGGQEMTPMPALGEEEPIAGPAEPYQGRDVIKPYQYQPRGPISYAYTGLPSLAPTRLRPSYTAKKSFSPLFPVS